MAVPSLDWLRRREASQQVFRPLHPELARVRLACVCGWWGCAASAVVLRLDLIRCPNCGLLPQAVPGR